MAASWEANCIRLEKPAQEIGFTALAHHGGNGSGNCARFSIPVSISVAVAG